MTALSSAMVRGSEVIAQAPDSITKKGDLPRSAPKNETVLFWEQVAGRAIHHDRWLKFAGGHPMAVGHA